MTVEKTLEYCLLMYPSIFPNKLAVYRHWFTVNGNGYEWVNGELVSDDQELIDIRKPTDMKKIVDKHFEFYMSDKRLLQSGLSYSRDELKKTIKSMFSLSTRKIDFSIKTIEKNITCYKFKVYPLCEYSQLLNVPEDVTYDWKEAANKMYDWLLRHKDLLTQSDLEYLKNVKNLD